jgi:hypothetical protein
MRNRSLTFHEKRVRGFMYAGSILIAVIMILLLWLINQGPGTSP